MYYRSLIVFALCTIFVASFVVVLNYEASEVGRQSAFVVSSQSTCSPAGAGCEALSMISASLHTVNYTDELGVVNYATLSLGLKAAGGSTISGVDLFIGNMSAGYALRPFMRGVIRVVNTTVPSTISVSPGKSYLVSVEGFYGSSSSVWASMKVMAT